LLPLSGTSMSAPVAAGSAALVRQYFQEGFYPALSSMERDTMNFTAPSAALVKAVLVLSGVPLADDSLPNLHEGHGRVQLNTVLVFEGEGVPAAPRPSGLWVTEATMDKALFLHTLLSVRHFYAIMLYSI
jgi:subtilisin family serine protease